MTLVCWYLRHCHVSSPLIAMFFHTVQKIISTNLAAVPYAIHCLCLTILQFGRLALPIGIGDSEIYMWRLNKLHSEAGIMLLTDVLEVPVSSIDWGIKYPKVFWAISQNCEKRLLALSCPSVRQSAWNNSAPTGRILMKLDISASFLTSVEKIQDLLKSDKNNGYFTRTRFDIF